jgi:hypothetical protein
MMDQNNSNLKIKVMKKIIVTVLCSMLVFGLFTALSSDAKRNNNTKVTLIKAAQVDTYCPVCQKRCCSPCFNGGTAPYCVELRFKDCSKCGHASSGHYAVSHS